MCSRSTAGFCADNRARIDENGSVIANFSNGDPPLSLIGDRLTGTYSATWQPGKVASPMTVTAFAAAGTLAPATAQLIGGVNPNQNPTPVLFKNRTMNNSNPVPGAALAPGTVAQVFGSGLASQTVVPGVVPLPTNFNGTGMLVGGLDAPLYYLSDGQLDVQIPFELAPNRQHRAIVIANGALTLPDTIDTSCSAEGPPSTTAMGVAAGSWPSARMPIWSRLR